MSKLTTRQITRIALMIAFISVASYIRIPLPFSEVALTAQTLVICTLALLLSPLETVVTMVSYWLLGFVGAPVYGGISGPSKMFGPTGGYLFGFILAAVFISCLKGKKYSFWRRFIITVLGSLMIINGIGFVWMKHVTGITWEAAFLTGFLPYIPLDIIKCIVAIYLAKAFQRVLDLH